ncbi:hypothetical protein CS022_14760 [Veronia nyctiphanis]|uniref:Uncharacterized protein n=1 Tax=Veronia nyctiphanis TaxID=1278244 RepID=A0A4Q0YNN2_9GAMM|nr:hypothetical protein [Veronia nyctiphanis]RXJ71819.1 hypothetical protein CS022_19305 [Veronia nyctiphanis]RXJ72570.1 hypothetical protein CS022_14760 [Veronia nyctiphanis]
MESFCETCNAYTKHTQHFQEKKDRYPNTFWGGVKKVIWETFIIGGSTDMLVKKLDELDLVVTCKTCGTKKIENQGRDGE